MNSPIIINYAYICRREGVSKFLKYAYVIYECALIRRTTKKKTTEAGMRTGFQITISAAGITQLPNPGRQGHEIPLSLTIEGY